MSSIDSTTGRKSINAPRIAITTGEPAGIGPEISLAALDAINEATNNASVTLIGDEGLLAERARAMRITFWRRSIERLTAPWPATTTQ